MKVALRSLLLCSLFGLFQSPVLADPPQPSPAPVLGQSDLQWLQQQERFVIGVRSGQVPLVFDTGDGVLAGIYIDYLARLSDKLGVPVDPVVLDDGGKDGSAGAKPDALLTTHAPGTRIPAGRRMTKPLMTLTYGLFVSAGDAAIQSLADLEGSRVAVLEGDVNQFSMLDPVEEFQPVPVEGIGEAVSAVLSGQAQAFVGPVPVVSDYLQSAMINGIGLARLLDSKPVDVIFEVPEIGRASCRERV